MVQVEKKKKKIVFPIILLENKVLLYVIIGHQRDERWSMEHFDIYKKKKLTEKRTEWLRRGTPLLGQCSVNTQLLCLIYRWFIRFNFMKSDTKIKRAILILHWNIRGWKQTKISHILKLEQKTFKFSTHRHVPARKENKFPSILTFLFNLIVYIISTRKCIGKGLRLRTSSRVAVTLKWFRYTFIPYIWARWPQSLTYMILSRF